MPPASDKALRLLYVVGTYPTITTTFIDREIDVLRDLGMSVDVISIRTPSAQIRELPEYREAVESSIKLLPTSFGTFVKAHARLLSRQPGRYTSTLWYLMTRRHPSVSAWLKTILHFGEAGLAANAVRRMRHDHIHAHFLDRASTLAFVLGRLLDLPYSVTAHANDIYVSPVLFEVKLCQASFVVTVSEFNRTHLLASVPGADADRIAVLHPWVDTADFKPRPEGRSNPARILSVGRLVEKKGHEYLIRACRTVLERGVEIDLTIVGDGPLRPKLEQLVNQLEIQERVRLAGSISQREVRRLAHESDLFVLACVVASDGDRDGIPVALAEAMAMELPVVSTNIVGISELVKGGSGLLVPERDPIALAQAIIDIVQNADRAAMGRAGRQVVASDFDLRAGVGELASWFRRDSAVSR